METRHKRVISFSLWSDIDKYLVGAIENVKLAPVIYPGWECWFYVPRPEDRNPKLERTITTIQELGAKTICWLDGIAGMYQRFLVADDPTVEYFAVRDADSRLSLREKAAVDEWIASGRLIHSCRDHVAHCRGLNGGTWAAIAEAMPHMETLLREWIKIHPEFVYGLDQEFLGRYIWTRFHMHSMQHDSCCNYPNSLPFPTKREGHRFVGEVFEADGTPRAGDWEQVIPNS